MCMSYLIYNNEMSHLGCPLGLFKISKSLAKCLHTFLEAQSCLINNLSESQPKIGGGHWAIMWAPQKLSGFFSSLNLVTVVNGLIYVIFLHNYCLYSQLVVFLLHLWSNIYEQLQLFIIWGCWNLTRKITAFSKSVENIKVFLKYETDQKLKMKQNLRGISYHFLDLWYWTFLPDCYSILVVCFAS